MLKNGDVVIDLYHENPAPDFGQLKAAGVAGVFLKASQGMAAWDEWFSATAKAVSDAGLEIGAYCFVDPAVSPMAQVHAFLDTVEQSGTVCGLGLAYDIEPCMHGGIDKWRTLTGNQASAYVRQLIRYTNVQVNAQLTVYASPSFWQETICNPCDSTEDGYRQDAMTNVRSWIAAYRFDEPEQLESFSGNPWLWQYTESGKTVGFDGDADLSRVISA